MRAGRLVVLVVLLAALTAAPAHATPHFVVGQGQNPGVAVDGAGTAYIGWQAAVGAETGDAVQLCVLPKGARACQSLATIAFPGSGYGVGRVSVLLPAPGVVQVAVGRNLQNVYGSSPSAAAGVWPERRGGASRARPPWPSARRPRAVPRAARRPARRGAAPSGARSRRPG